MTTRKRRQITRGQRNIAWIEANLFIPKGADFGRPVKLRPWQKRAIRRIYDNQSGTRTAILSFGRKNGKTALAAMLLLLHLCGPEARPNTAIYSTAQSLEQAAIVYKFAYQMVTMSEGLAPFFSHLTTKKYLRYEPLGVEYQALSKEPKSKLGLGPALVIHDELGEVRGPNSDLFDALETAAAAEEEPLSIIISSQAANSADLLSVLIDDALAGEDPHTVLELHTADQDVDPFSVRALKQANPAMGDFQSKSELLKQADKARRMPSFEAMYRNRILNQRVALNNPFVTRTIWEANTGDVLKSLAGLDVYGGLDLSKVRDLTSLVLIAKHLGIWHVHPLFWLPADGLTDAQERDRQPYVMWHRQGLIETTPGRTIDYEYIAHHLRRICTELSVRKIGFDDWNFPWLRKELGRVGFGDEEIDRLFVPVKQGWVTMSPALKGLEADLIEQRFAHGMHPVLTMCAANATVKLDAAGNRMLDKSNPTGRIDGMVSLTMARHVAQSAAELRPVTGKVLFA